VRRARKASRDSAARCRVRHGRYDFDGSRLRVEFGRGKRDGGAPSRSGPGPTGNNRIYIEGLDNYTSWQDLKDFARRAGHPVFTDVFHDRGGKVRAASMAADAQRSVRACVCAQVGVVEYKNRDDVYEAVRSLDGAVLHDRRVRVVEVALPPRPSLSSSFSISLRRK
jgi:RNA recognition motif-containing protein